MNRRRPAPRGTIVAIVSKMKAIVPEFKAGTQVRGLDKALKAQALMPNFGDGGGLWR